jgi:hypothetical protein
MATDDERIRDEVLQEWIEVAEQRYDDWKAGRGTTRPAEEVLRDLVAKYGRHTQEPVADEINAARWNPQWRVAWIAEIERRQRRLETGEDRELTLEEFFSDED